MIGRAHAKKEIARLASTHFYPSKQPAALSELIDALQLGSKTPEHATLVITEALDVSTSCPTPADLRRLCAEVVRSTQAWPDPCEKCRGNWRMCRILWKGKETTASVRCTCARGRLLTDRENEERRKEDQPELRLQPGITFIEECDRDLADLHGFELEDQPMKTKRTSAGNHEAADAILADPSIAGGCLALIEWACLFKYRMAALAIKNRPGSIAEQKDVAK